MKAQSAIGLMAAAVAVMGLQTRPASAAPASLTIYPSTDIYPKGNWHLDSDIVSGSNFRNTTFASAGINYGIGPERNGLFGRSDIGLEYLPAPLSGVSGSNRLVLNAKTQLFNRLVMSARGPMSTRLVFGLRGFGNKGNPATGNSTAPKDVIYLLGSHLTPFGRVHVGVAHSFAEKAFLTTPAGNAARTYLQLGYDVPISKQARFAVDYYTGKSTISALAPSIIYEVDDRAAFQLGYIRYNDSSINPRNQIYGALDYDFGSGAKRIVRQHTIMEQMEQMKRNGGMAPAMSPINPPAPVVVVPDVAITIPTTPLPVTPNSVTPAAPSINAPLLWRN